MAMHITPAQYAEKQARNLKASIPDIQRGVQAVTVAPTQLAAAQSAKMLAGIQESVTSGKWGRALAAVSLEEWKAQTLTKGVPRIAMGIDQAQAKVQSFAAKLLPYEAALQEQIDKMPDLNIEDSIARSNAWIRGMAKFKNA